MIAAILVIIISNTTLISTIIRLEMTFSWMSKTLAAKYVAAMIDLLTLIQATLQVDSTSFVSSMTVSE